MFVSRIKLLVLFSLSAAHAFAPFGQPLKLQSRNGAASTRIGITMQATKIPVLTKDLFDKLDRDRSGTIDLSELKEGEQRFIFSFYASEKILTNLIDTSQLLGNNQLLILQLLWRELT
jgi:hypothetical protein